MCDLTFEVRRGSVFGLLGPNGAGKTTTIRLLLGLITPSSGYAEVLGHDTTGAGDAIRAAAGVLLDHPGHYERLTAQENLEFHGRIAGMSAEGRRLRIRELLTHFGLYERRRDPVSAWSRGMRQKLALARAHLHRPDILFLDEPTAGLDPAAAASLRQDITSLASRERTTIVLSTHNLPEAEKMCDVVGIMRDGRLVACGPPASLRRRDEGTIIEITGRDLDGDVSSRLSGLGQVTVVSSGSRELLLELGPRADRALISRTIVEAGGEIEALQEKRRTLEELYLEAVGRPG